MQALCTTAASLGGAARRPGALVCAARPGPTLRSALRALPRRRRLAPPPACSSSEGGRRQQIQQSQAESRRGGGRNMEQAQQKLEALRHEAEAAKLLRVELEAR